jgi:hypothetical protein
MMAMTTSNSIRVKPRRPRVRVDEPLMEYDLRDQGKKGHPDSTGMGLTGMNGREVAKSPECERPYFWEGSILPTASSSFFSSAVGVVFVIVLVFPPQPATKVTVSVESKRADSTRIEERGMSTLKDPEGLGVDPRWVGITRGLCARYRLKIIQARSLNASAKPRLYDEKLMKTRKVASGGFF